MIQKVLGRGLQHVVYDIGGNRVRKRPTTRLEKAITFIKWRCYNPLKIYRGILSAEETTHKSISLLQARIKNIDHAFLGNPSFKDISYEQDRATPIGVYFLEHAGEENKKIIDLYVQSLFKTWGCGFSDIVFNFTLNNAIDRHGQVVLIDLGELTFSISEIMDCIVSKKWLRQSSYQRLPDELKSYFSEKMNEEITPENLKKYWESATRC